MTDSVVIVGAAMTPFGPQPSESVRSLAERAVREALADAELGVDDVDLVVFANASGGLYDGQEMIRGQVALRHSGLLGKPILNVENACAGSSSALHVGVMAVRSGAASTVLVVGAEKLAQPAKTRTLAKTTVQKLFRDIGPRNKDRNGGYTRIIRMARTRTGDNASQCIFELVESPWTKVEKK